MTDQQSSFEKVLKERISRRRFVETGVAAGLGLGAAALLGCGDQSTSRPSAGTPAASTGTAPAVITSPKPKGSVVFAVGSSGTETIDAHYEKGGGEFPITRAMYEPLITNGPDGKIVPGLAESWTAAPEGWTFNLRKGVKFHTGNEFTAEDVAFSWDRTIDPALENPQGVQLSRILDRPKILDKHKIFFPSPKPYPGLLNLFMWFLVADGKQFQKVGEKAFGSTDPSGTGPWRFVKRAKGQFVEFEAFEEHWGTVPKVKTVNMRIIPEAATRFAALQTGEVDITALSGVQYDEVRRGGTNIKAAIVKDSGQFIINFVDLYHGTPSPFQDVRVRKAMMLALNVEQMAEKVYYGLAKPGITNFMSSTFGADLSLRPPGYKPDEAKRLLAEAGYANGFETVIADYAVSIDRLQAMAGDWDRIGVKVKFDLYEVAAFHAKFRSKQFTTGMAIIGGQTYVDGMMGMITYLIPSSSWSYVGDKKLQDMYDAASVEMDDKKREKLMQEFNKYSYENFYNPTPLWFDSARGYGPKVAEYKPHAGMSFSQNFETIVLKG